MTKHVLPIKSTYVSQWGLWEALRELIQNSKDEEDERGNKMVVEHRDGALHIENIGADLQVRALLIGESSKVGKRGLRGQHGEGLDLALLCAARSEYEVKVFTRTEVWTPRIEYVAEFGERCLVINTRKLKAERDRVTVTIRITKDDWKQFKPRFLFLDPPKDAIAASTGTLIADADRRGIIYVKGIYVMTAHKTNMGFDLNEVTLDRDRRMIGDFDLQWACGRIMQEALSRDPERFVSPVLALLEQGADEVEYLYSHLGTGTDASKALAKAFVEKHGPDAVAVSSMAESQMLEHVGAKGVVVNTAMARVLAPELGEASAVAAKRRMLPSKLYSWNELTEAEQVVYNDAVARIAAVAGAHMAQTFQLKVADFPDGSVDGKCNLGTGEMHISRASLSSVYRALEALVHELAHAVTQAKDGTMSHVRAIESIWSELYKQLNEKVSAASA